MSLTNGLYQVRSLTVIRVGIYFLKQVTRMGVYWARNQKTTSARNSAVAVNKVMLMRSILTKKKL